MAEFNKSGRVKMRLGEQLVAAGLLTADALEDALKRAREEDQRLGEYLVSAGFRCPSTIARRFRSTRSCAR